LENLKQINYFQTQVKELEKANLQLDFELQRMKYNATSEKHDQGAIYDKKHIKELIYNPKI